MTDSEDLLQRAKASLVVSKLIAGSFIVSVAILGLVGWLQVEESAPASVGAVNEGVVYGLVGAAFVNIMIGELIARYLFGVAKKKGERGEGDVTAVMGMYLLHVIVGSALRESVAIIGFVVVMLTHDMTWMYILGCASLILLYRAFPKEEHLQELFPQLRFV